MKEIVRIVEKHGNWLVLEETDGKKWNVDHVSNPGMGYNSAVRIAPDTAHEGLSLFLADESGGMRIYLWPDSIPVPVLPHSRIKPTAAIYGDVLIGDIITIARNPMTLFLRQEKNLSASSPTVLFSANNVWPIGIRVPKRMRSFFKRVCGPDSDVDGGAEIIMHPDHHQDLDTWSDDPVDHPQSGALQLLAYGRGPGVQANAIIFKTRSGPRQVAERMMIKDGQVMVYGNLHVTGTIALDSSKKITKNIMYISELEAMDLFAQLRPVSFVCKTDPSGHQRMGFIAEDIPEVFATPGRNGVDSMGVTALLTKVVQEQRNVVQAQQKQIDQLRKRLAKLEATVEVLSTR